MQEVVTIQDQNAAHILQEEAKNLNKEHEKLMQIEKEVARRLRDEIQSLRTELKTKAWTPQRPG